LWGLLAFLLSLGSNGLDVSQGWLEFMGGGMGRKRQPDLSLKVNWPKGPSSRLAIIVALIGALAIITGALINTGILPRWFGDAWDRIFDRPPSSGSSASESKVAPSGQVQVPVGHRRALPLPSSAAGKAGQQLLDVAAGGGRFVAVGWTGTPTDGDGVVWLSKNREDWTPARDPGDTFRSRAGDQKLYGVVASREGIVAVGSDGEAAAVWTSEDGQEWAKAPHQPGAFSGGGAQEMRSVAKHSKTLVAVGAREQGGDRKAAGWYLSTDGEWQRAIVHSSGSRSDGTYEVMRDVAWINDRLVAVGTVRSGRQADFEAAVWTSADGRVWTQVPPADVDERCAGGGCSGSQSMYGVAEKNESAVAVGLDGPTVCGRVAAVWRSVDNGSTWRRVPQTKALNGKSMRMNAVAPTGDGYIAVGSRECEERQQATVWVSSDGIDWRLVQVATRRGWEGMAGAALSPQGGVVAGSRGNGTTAKGLTWRVGIR
jgi:hypothetical protein